MFSKLIEKHSSNSQKGERLIDLNPLVIHYGIPSTSSRLAYDPVQQLLAVGTLDGRIKVIGGHSIEGLLTSPNELPFKYLEFLQNQGFLISVSNENNVQVWDLEHRCTSSTLQWNSNVTAFAVIQETNYMYIGDDSGLVSVLKYDAIERKLALQPYSISTHSVSEAAGIPLLNNQSVIGVLPQPCSRGNRVLFAYGNGVIVLWDVSKDKLVLIRGCNDHEMKARFVDNSAYARSNQKDDQALSDGEEEKEIISLCWASLDGSILAVGYVDGDIMLWNLSGVATTEDHKAGKPTNNVVKLQLSSANRRFPVIVLHWSASGLHSDDGGQLFVYGGDEIGSAEVLTILSLEWASRREALKNIKRVNITLEGSFADMILLQSFSVLENAEAPSLFLLSSPGQLQFYDSSCISGLISHQDKSCSSPIHYKSAVPTTEPYMTVGRLISVYGLSKSSVALSMLASAVELQETYISSDKSSKWPLNGGVPCHLPQLGERDIERLYIAGYQDGSVRIWDATYPMLSLIIILDPEVKNITTPGVATSVSALEFSSETLSVAIGSTSGMIRHYNLSGNSNETGLHVLTGTQSEVYSLDQGNGSLLSAVFMLSSSPVCSLRYTSLGASLAVGYASGQVAILNVNSSSVLSFVDTLTNSSSPVISFAPATFLDANGMTAILDHSETQGQNEPAKELIFALKSDLHVAVIDGSSWDVISSFPQNHNKESTAISMYILEGMKFVVEVGGGDHVDLMSHEDESKAEPAQLNGRSQRNFDGISRSTNFIQCTEDSQILLCCTDVLQLYSLKSVIQGHGDSIHEVNLLKICCWTATFNRDEKESGLMVLYQTGSIEIRALPNLEVIAELSLMSILRWNYKTNMDRTMSCTDNGQITLVNGCEFVVVSLLASDSSFRTPLFSPCLHDKSLAAALDLNFSPKQNRNKEPPSGILGGIMRGLRSSKEAESMEPVEERKSVRSSLDKIFSRSTPDPSPAPIATDKVVELNIDDIEIDGPLRVSPIADKSEDENKDKRTPWQKLFEGGTSETKPKQRSVDEIKAKYRKAGDTSSAVNSAASAASQARDKLLERQEKLERISQNSEELRNGAENFASMAKELAKRMENRKWWQL